MKSVLEYILISAILFIVLLFLGVEIDPEALFVMIFAFFIGCIYVAVVWFLTRNEHHKTEITQHGLVFLDDKEKKLHNFEEYDGFLLVKVLVKVYDEDDKDDKKTYLYLVKDHKRKDVIQLDDEEYGQIFLAELEQHMMRLGEKEISDRKHLFGGGRIKY